MSIFFFVNIFNGFLKKIFLLILYFLFLLIFFAEIATIEIVLPVLIQYLFFYDFNSLYKKATNIAKTNNCYIYIFFISLLNLYQDMS